MSAADALSRAINLTLKAKKTSEPEGQPCVDLLVKSVPVADKRLEQIKMETEKNDSQRMLNEVVIQGNSKDKVSCDFSLRHHWNNRQMWHQHLHKKTNAKAKGIWRAMPTIPASFLFLFTLLTHAFLQTFRLFSTSPFKGTLLRWVCCVSCEA